MPAIKPKPAAPQLKRITLSYPEDQLAVLDDFVRFLGGATDRVYVLVEAVKSLTKNHAGFRRHRADQDRPSTPNDADGEASALQPPTPAVPHVPQDTTNH